MYARRPGRGGTDNLLVRAPQEQEVPSEVTHAERVPGPSCCFATPTTKLSVPPTPAGYGHGTQASCCFTTTTTKLPPARRRGSFQICATCAIRTR